MDPIHYAVFDIIKDAAGERVSRSHLVWTLKTMGFNVSDRSARDAVSEVAKRHPEGGHILSSSHSAGYWHSDDPEEMLAAAAELKSRIYELSVRETNLRRAASEQRAEPLRQAALL